MTKHNFVHTDHLEQNKGHGGGVHKSSGSKKSHLDQSKQNFKKANGNHLDPIVPGRGPVPSTKDHLKPHRPLTDKTAVRGGGGLLGHDRSDPTKARSGDYMTQQPSLVNPKRKQKVINPYTPK